MRGKARVNVVMHYEKLQYTTDLSHVTYYCSYVLYYCECNILLYEYSSELGIFFTASILNYCSFIVVPLAEGATELQLCFITVGMRKYCIDMVLPQVCCINMVFSDSTSYTVDL